MTEKEHRQMRRRDVTQNRFPPGLFAIFLGVMFLMSGIHVGLIVLMNRLILSVFVREVSFVEEEVDGAKTNTILLDGYICKRPIYRKTPLGREIADLLLAVNRPYGKSDYIPCISWGRNARFAEKFEVGGHLYIWGRIQSREYQKKLSETEVEKRVAYEVSVSKVEFLED